MKKLWKKFKDWLIVKLGGYTLEEVWARCDGEINDYIKMHVKIVNAWRKAVQEICRRSDNSCYDWCCEYCARNCGKCNGWCEKFVPKEGDNDERCC